MSNYEPMPMNTADLEHFTDLFHVTIAGIEEHLTNDEPDKEFIINALIALSRQLDRISHDVVMEFRQVIEKYVGKAEEAV